MSFGMVSSAVKTAGIKREISWKKDAKKSLYAPTPKVSHNQKNLLDDDSEFDALSFM